MSNVEFPQRPMLADMGSGCISSFLDFCLFSWKKKEKLNLHQTNASAFVSKMTTNQIQVFQR